MNLSTPIVLVFAALLLLTFHDLSPYALIVIAVGWIVGGIARELADRAGWLPEWMR